MHQGTVTVLYRPSNYRRILFFFHCEGGNGDQKRWKPWLGWFQQGQIHLEAKACQEPVRNVTGAFSLHPCSEKDSPQFVRKFWDAVERLWSSQRDAPWCFIGSSWNVRVWLQSLSGEPELLSVSVRNCSGAEQNLAQHSKEIWFSCAHSPFSAPAVAGHFCTIFSFFWKWKETSPRPSFFCSSIPQPWHFPGVGEPLVPTWPWWGLAGI